MAKLNRRFTEGAALRCKRSEWHSLTIGSRANATGWKDDRYSCHKTERAAVKAFQKRCKPGSKGYVSKGREGGFFSGVKCKRS